MIYIENRTSWFFILPIQNQSPVRQRSCKRMRLHDKLNQLPPGTALLQNGSIQDGCRTTDKSYATRCLTSGIKWTSSQMDSEFD